MPTTWNIPEENLNPNFTGRVDYLEQLRARLAAGQPTAVTQPLAVHGLGGIGKTQLALKYAQTYKETYAVGLWVSARDATALPAEYASLARELGLPAQDLQETDLIVAAVRDTLSRNHSWLLIFDNAEEPEQLKRFLPHPIRGHVIITARNPNWRGLGIEPLSLDVMSEADAVAFLHGRTGQTGDGAEAVAAELGRLPLALQHAGAYIAETGMAYLEYLALLQSHRQELFSQATFPPDYPATVVTTWNLAYRDIREQDPAALDLLRLCAYLNPDNIPLEVLSEGSDHLPDPLADALADPLKRNNAIRLLQRYALLTRSGDYLNVHPLVQAVTRDRLPPEARESWGNAAVSLLADAFPDDIYDNPVTWDDCERLLPHAIAANEQAQVLGLESETMALLLNEVGVHLYTRVEYKEARPYYERALAIREKVLGPHHPHTAGSLNNLAEILRAQGAYEEARPYCERALAIREKVLGPDHPHTAGSLNNLALLLQDQGAHEEARPYYERALAIREKVLGPHHHDTASSLAGLGLLLQVQRAYEEARPHLERALTICEQLLGPDHPRTASSLNNLGLLLKSQGSYKEAHPYYERALAIREKVLGPNHHHTAQSLNNLAELLRAQGEYKEARPYCERALAIREQVLGPDHPHTATNLNNLALLFQDQGRYEEARPYFKRALVIFEQVFGPDHPTTTIIRNNLNALEP